MSDDKKKDKDKEKAKPKAEHAPQGGKVYKPDKTEKAAAMKCHGCPRLIGRGHYGAGAINRTSSAMPQTRIAGPRRADAR